MTNLDHLRKTELNIELRSINELFSEEFIECEKKVTENELKLNTKCSNNFKKENFNTETRVSKRKICEVNSSKFFNETYIENNKKVKLSSVSIEETTIDNLFVNDDLNCEKSILIDEEKSNSNLSIKSSDMNFQNNNKKLSTIERTCLNSMKTKISKLVKYYAKAFPFELIYSIFCRNEKKSREFAFKCETKNISLNIPTKFIRNIRFFTAANIKSFFFKKPSRHSYGWSNWIRKRTFNSRDQI